VEIDSFGLKQTPTTILNDGQCWGKHWSE